MTTRLSMRLAALTLGIAGLAIAPAAAGTAFAADSHTGGTVASSTHDTNARHDTNGMHDTNSQDIAISVAGQLPLFDSPSSDSRLTWLLGRPGLHLNVDCYVWEHGLHGNVMWYRVDPDRDGDWDYVPSSDLRLNLLGRHGLHLRLCGGL